MTSSLQKTKANKTVQQHTQPLSRRLHGKATRRASIKLLNGENNQIRTATKPKVKLRRPTMRYVKKGCPRRRMKQTPKPTEQDLIEIAREGCLSKLLETVKHIENVTLFGEKGAREEGTQNTLLHIATKFNHLPIAETLLLLGANPDPKNNAGDTPLCFALREKAHVFVIEMLIRHKASPVAETNNGKTPQMILEENPYLRKRDKLRALLGMDSYRVSAIKPSKKRVNKIRWLDETYSRIETLDKDTYRAYRNIWDGITNYGLRLRKDQLIHLLHACGLERFENAELTNMMEQLDINQDGKVDFNDFLVWIMISAGDAVRYQVPVRAQWKRAECERSIFHKPFEMLSHEGRVITAKAYRFLGGYMSPLGPHIYPQSEYEVNKIFSRLVDDYQPHSHNHLSGLELDTFCAMIENEVNVENFHRNERAMIKAKTLAKYQDYVTQHKREHKMVTPVPTSD